MTLCTSILSLLGSPTIASAGATFWMPEQASTIAGKVDWIFNFITWLCIFFFVVIVSLMIVFAVKYRRREGVRPEKSPTHNMPLEVTWSVIPLILVILIFYLGLKGYVGIATPPQNAYEINVTGQRWFWTFNYPNGATETNILHVPVGRPIKLTMRSDDVIHSLFIPSFRVKQDVVPGRRTGLWFQATREGEFDLFCAEYCGRDHSQMIGKVVVHDPDEFEGIIEELAAWIDKVSDESLHKAGVLIYNQCSSCHTVDGSQGIGPSFKDTWELYHKQRNNGLRALADGTTVVVDEDYLRRSITAPLEQIAEGFARSMPPGIGTQLGARKVDAMVQFITHLDEVAPNGQLIEVSRQEFTVETPQGD